MRLIDADALYEELRYTPYDNILEGTIGHERPLTAIVNAPTVGCWISVKDRLPEKDGDYLVYSTFELVDRLRFFDGVWWDYGAECQPGVVTHWMPLPEPPEVSKNG